MVDLFLRIFMSLSFLGGAIFLVYQFVYFYRQGKRSLRWPHINGVIKESRIETVLNGDAPDIKFIINYEYEVEGKSYISDNLFFKTYDLNEIDYTRKYPVGKQVKVFYNPEKPNEAVLEIGPRPEIQLLIVFALIMLGVAYIVSPL